MTELEETQRRLQLALQIIDLLLAEIKRPFEGKTHLSGMPGSITWVDTPLGTKGEGICKP